MINQQELHNSLPGTPATRAIITYRIHNNMYIMLWVYLALLVRSEKVLTLIPGMTGMAHAACGWEGGRGGGGERSVGLLLSVLT